MAASVSGVASSVSFTALTASEIQHVAKRFSRGREHQLLINLALRGGTIGGFGQHLSRVAVSRRAEFVEGVEEVVVAGLSREAPSSAWRRRRSCCGRERDWRAPYSPAAWGRAVGIARRQLQRWAEIERLGIDALPVVLRPLDQWSRHRSRRTGDCADRLPWASRAGMPPADSGLSGYFRSTVLFGASGETLEPIGGQQRACANGRSRQNSDKDCGAARTDANIDEASQVEGKAKDFWNAA